MGNPAKPTALKLLEGNRGHRDIPDDNPEPEPMPKLPNPPKWLDRIARRTWRTLGVKLYESGVLTEWDLIMFARFCHLVSKTERELDNNTAFQQLRMYAALFGVDPADRGKLHVVKEKKAESKFGRFLK